MANRGEGQNIGFVTSAAYSPDWGQNIAFAMLNMDYAETGQTLTITSTVARIKQQYVIFRLKIIR